METISDLGSHTLTALFSNSVNKFADRPALGFSSGTPITYRQFGEKIIETRNLLYRYGIQPGDRVAIYAPSSPNWGIAYFAIVSLGAIAVPLLPDFSAKEAETCLRHAEVNAVFASARHESRLPGQEALRLSALIRLDDFSVTRGLPVREGSAPSFEPRENDTASIIYTSGTTGRSKGVELSHKNLVFTAIGGQFFQRINKYDVALSILPLSHVYEFTIGFLMFMLNGACVRYLEKPPTVSTLLPALARVRPTLMLSVPIIMEKIYKSKIVPTFTANRFLRTLYSVAPFRFVFHRIAGLGLKRTFGGRLKFFGIGGSRVDPVVERFMKEAKFPYAIGYGLTETSPLIAGSGPNFTKPESVGPAMPGVELALADIDAATGIGEVVVRGANVMKGYYNAPELTAAVLSPEGWLRTGDLGSLDRKKGAIRLSLKGRSKNMILGAAGENIYPEDIEFILNQHPFVSESLVVEGENSSLVAIVQLDEDRVSAEARRRASSDPMQAVRVAAAGAVSDMSHAVAYKREEILNEIKFFVNENVNRISRIDQIRQIEAFEKTASQKIKRYLYALGAVPGRR